MLRNRSLVTIEFREIVGLTIEDFNHQNALLGLRILDVCEQQDRPCAVRGALRFRIRSGSVIYMLRRRTMTLVDENALLSRWLTGKLTRAFHRLRTPITAEFEYRRQFGHPSSYAFVRLEATPADRLNFEAIAQWPDGVGAEEARDFERAIAEGLIDVLFAGLEPHRGCSVRLTNVRFDAVGSSYFAFCSAAAKSAELLVRDGAWERVIDPSHVR